MEFTLSAGKCGDGPLITAMGCPRHGCALVMDRAYEGDETRGLGPPVRLSSSGPALRCAASRGNLTASSTAQTQPRRATLPPAIFEKSLVKGVPSCSIGNIVFYDLNDSFYFRLAKIWLNIVGRYLATESAVSRCNFLSIGRAADGSDKMHESS